MKVLCKLVFLSFAFFYPDTSAIAQADLIACGDDCVLMIDSRKSQKRQPYITWSWKLAEAKELPEAYHKVMIPLDECKPIMGGKQLLLTSSGGGVLLLEVATKKILFYAKSPMAHSAEMLPGGIIAVALSTHAEGNSIELYDSRQNNSRLFKDSLYSAHGLVWSEKRQQLFALGFDELRAYRLVNHNSDSLSLIMEKTWKLPNEGGHDLSAVDENEMIVSTHHNVFKFDVKKESFTVFNLLSGKHDVKSANYNKENKNLVYTQAEQSWWTYNIYSINPNKTIHIPHIKLYKVRVLNIKPH